MCGKVGARLLIFNPPGIGRVFSSVFSDEEFRCKIYVDDPEEALKKDHAPSLSRCWPSPSWVSFSLGTKPVSVTVWCGSASSSQLDTLASQWPFQRTSSMICTARRPGSCQPQLHKGKIFGHSAASFRLLLARSRRSGLSLTWFERHWPQAPDCRGNSCTVGASGWRFGGCRLSSPRFLVRLSGSSRSQHRGP